MFTWSRVVSVLSSLAADERRGRVMMAATSYCRGLRSSIGSESVGALEPRGGGRGTAPEHPASRQSYAG